MALTGFAHSYYFAQLSVGTPAQNFNVILDTGSADFWLVDSACSTANGCASNLIKFNTGSSSTNVGSSTPFAVRYGTGAVQGTLAADKVSLAGYTVNNLTFAEASDVASNTIDYPASGIMGMGFQSLASSGATPFWQVLGKQGVLSANVFSFQLARNIDNVDITDANVNSVQNPGGVFTLGTLDSNQYSGDITYVSIPNNLQNTAGLGYWTIPLGGVSINNVAANIGSNPLAAIDTGTTLIGGPSASIRAIYSLISGAQSASGMSGYYLFPCSTNLDIEMQFGGRSFQMNTQDFNLGPYPYTTSSTCLGAFFEINLGSTAYGVPQWIIGDSFLKNVFSVYDGSGRVGFASLKGSDAQTVAPTSNAVASATAVATSTSAAASTSRSSVFSILSSAVLPSISTTAAGATRTAILGGSSLPVPSASSAAATTTPSLSSGGSSRTSSASSPRPPNAILATSLIAAALFAGAGIFV